MFIYTLESRIIVGVGIIGWGGNKDVLGGKKSKNYNYKSVYVWPQLDNEVST